MRVLAAFVSLLPLFAASPAAAETEPRVALVIGNNAYGSGLRELNNAVSDAQLIAGTLERAGFDVEEVENADQARMEIAVKNFRERLRDAGEGAVAVFYFAGHGLQADSANFLMGTDAPVASPQDISRFGLDADYIISHMIEGGAMTNILLLDACRPNRVAKNLQSVASKGLSQIDVPGMEDRDLLMAYATGLGESAADGAGGNGPFAEAMAQNMLIEDLSIYPMFDNVSEQMKGTGQRPRLYGTPFKFVFVTGSDEPGQTALYGGHQMFAEAWARKPAPGRKGRQVSG